MTWPHAVTQGPHLRSAGKKSSRHFVAEGHRLHAPPCLGDEDSTVDLMILAPTTIGAILLVSICSSWHRMQVCLWERGRVGGLTNVENGNQTLGKITHSLFVVPLDIHGLHLGCEFGGELGLRPVHLRHHFVPAIGGGCRATFPRLEFEVDDEL